MKALAVSVGAMTLATLIAAVYVISTSNAWGSTIYLDEEVVEFESTYCDRYIEGYYDGACPYKQDCNAVAPICMKGEHRSTVNSYASGYADGRNERYNDEVPFEEEKDVQQ